MPPWATGPQPGVTKKGRASGIKRHSRCRPSSSPAVPEIKRGRRGSNKSRSASRKPPQTTLENSLGMKMRALLTILVLAGVLACPAEEPKAFDPAGPNTNGLGMRFVPVPGTKVLFSVYQTRVKDFQAFVRESGYVHMRETADADSRMWSLDRDGYKQRGHSWENPGFKQTEDHPVVGVSWYDAKAFCEWLTSRERAAERLPAGWEYRLPTDHEWSMAVGLVEEDPAKTPEQKDGAIKDRYPWGEWLEGKPPPAGAGNYAGAEADDGHWPANC